MSDPKILTEAEIRGLMEGATPLPWRVVPSGCGGGSEIAQSVSRRSGCRSMTGPAGSVQVVP